MRIGLAVIVGFLFAGLVAIHFLGKETLGWIFLGITYVGGLILLVLLLTKYGVWA